MLSIYETTPVSESEDSYDEIINEYMDSGDFAKARQEYEKMLSEAREELGEEAPLYKDIAKYRWLYYLIIDETTEAERLIAEDIAFIESTYGKRSMEMADFLSMLSFQMIDRAHFEYGIDLAKRAISICEELNQKQSYVYIKSQMDLIVANTCLGDFYSAGDIAKELDFKRYSGTEYITDILRSVGLVYLELGFYKKVIELSNRVINSKKADRLSIVLAYEILLVYNERKGDIIKAEYYLGKVEEQIKGLTTLAFAKGYLVIYYRFSARIKSRKKENSNAVTDIDQAVELFEDKCAYSLLSCYQDRMVYNTYLNDCKEAECDFAKCMEIVNKYGLSPRINFLLFNNVALIHYKKEEYREAEKYYEMILEIQPDIINCPTNYTEAMICQNYGWIKHNLDDSVTAEKYIHTAISFYEENGFIESSEYVTAKYNLSLIYTSQNRFEDNLSILLDLYDKIEKINESDCYTEMYISTGITLGLLATEKEQDAYNFAYAEDKRFETKYGENSLEQIEFLQKVSFVFKYFGYEESFEFLEKSRELIVRAKLEHSIIQASQLNYVGVAFLDLYEDFRNAKRYFTEARALLEELNEQKNPLYNLVCKNMNKAEEIAMDDLIKKMVESMTDDE